MEYESLKRVYIILVNWNGWRDTIECLESLFRSDYPDFRVVVCDNGSDDDSLERIKSWADGCLSTEVAPDSPLYQLSHPPVPKPINCFEYFGVDAVPGGAASQQPPLVQIRITTNLGFAGGNNVGLRYALAQEDFSHAWLLNNDTVVDPHALTAMVQRMEGKPDAGMCGSTLLYYERPDRVQALGGGWHCRWLGLPWHYGRFCKRFESIKPLKAEARMNYVEGASLLVSKQFLEEIGLMCEDYFLFFEETDWAIRALGRYTLAYAPQSVVYHKVGASIGTSSKPWEKSYLCDYFSVRNRLFFTRRYYPHAFPAVYLTLIATLFARVILGKWDRVQMIIRLLAGNYETPLDQVLPQIQSDYNGSNDAQR